MKATELRIGNYYKGASRGNIEIVSWQTLRDLSEGKLNLLPIPLTEEWLLRFGFEQKTSSFVIYPVSIKRQTKNAFFYSPTSLHLKYVHQLQNLYFALTGEELVLKN